MPDSTGGMSGWTWPQHATFLLAAVQPVEAPAAWRQIYREVGAPEHSSPANATPSPICTRCRSSACAPAADDGLVPRSGYSVPLGRGAGVAVPLMIPGVRNATSATGGTRLGKTGTSSSLGHQPKLWWLMGEGLHLLDPPTGGVMRRDAVAPAAVAGSPSGVSSGCNRAAQR